VLLVSLYEELGKPRFLNEAEWVVSDVDRVLGRPLPMVQFLLHSATGVQIEHEQPYQAIIDTAAKRGCDSIVMASHGRRGVAAIILGSETVKVLTHSTIPVIVVRGKALDPFLVAS
jgi:nucleotide-binding universal stress UspA family protein